MKKYIFIPALILATINCSAQYETIASVYELEIDIQNATKEGIVSNGIKTKKNFSVQTDRNGNVKAKYLSSESEYNEKGLPVKTIQYKNNNKIKSEVTYTYNTNNEITSTVRLKPNGKTKSKSEKKYDENGNQTAAVFYKSGGKKTRYNWTAKYDSNGNKIEAQNYKGKQAKPTSKWEYQFDESGERKATFLYNAKGKLKRKWSYACNGEGALVTAKKVDQSEICTMVERDKDGNKLKVVRKTNDQNEIIKTVYRYNKEDQLTDLTFYNAKDKIIVKYVYSYTENKQLKGYSSFKSGDRLSLKREFEYNDKGILSAVKWKHKENGQLHVKNYEYSLF
jgi:hypothetical protein